MANNKASTSCFGSIQILPPAFVLMSWQNIIPHVTNFQVPEQNLASHHETGWRCCSIKVRKVATNEVQKRLEENGEVIGVLILQLCRRTPNHVHHGAYTSSRWSLSMCSSPSDEHRCINSPVVNLVLISVKVG